MDILTGYQDTKTGRRMAPRACWSDVAFQEAMGIPAGLRAPTKAQRRIGIIGFDETGRAIYDGEQSA